MFSHHPVIISICYFRKDLFAVMKKKAVLHFLRGYLLLLVCLLIVFTVFYAETFHLFESRQLSIAGQSLNAGVRQFELQINHLSHIALSLRMDPDYLAFSHTQVSDLRPADYIHLGNLQSEFTRLCLAQPNISDYGILYRSGIQLTQERIFIPIDDSYGSFIRFGNMDLQEYMETFTNFPGTTRFLPVMEISKYGEGDKPAPTYPGLIWLCKLSRGNVKTRNDVVYAVFSLDTLDSLFLSDHGFNAGNSGYHLVTSDGQTLVSYGVLPEDTSGKHKISTSLLSDTLHITLTISESLFADMMRPIRNMLFLFFGAVLLIGILMSFIIAGRASLPLRRLLTLVDELDPRDTNLTSGSFERIGSTMKNLASSVEEQRVMLKSQQEKVRDHIFEGLLQETPVPESAVSIRQLNDFSLYFPTFPGRYVMAMISLPKDQVNELPRNQVKLQSILESFFTPVPYVYMSGFYTVVILDTSIPGHDPAILVQVRHEAAQNGKLPLLIALSEEADSPNRLHALFLNTRHMIHLAEQEEDRDLVDIWQRKHFPEPAPALPMDYTQMSQLYTLIKKADSTGADSLLHDVFRHMMTASLTDDVMVRQVFYNIRSVLLRVKIEKLEWLSDIDIPDFSFQLEYRTQMEKLESCCNRICEKLTPVMDNKRSIFISSVMGYIEEHLSDSALGVRTVSDHFDVSEPTIQKIVRQEKQSSFFEYVENRRYEIACELLRNTSLPIAQIAEKCGYNSLNSFYKAFRRNSDATPAQMRHQYQDDQTAEE